MRPKCALASVVLVVQCLLGLIALPCSAGAEAPLEVRFQPGETLYVFPNQAPGGRGGLFTAVIHNIAFVNRGAGAVTLEEARIEVERGGETVQIVLIDEPTLQSSAQSFHAFENGGALAAFDSHFQTSRYLEGIGFSESATPQPGEAVVVTGRTLLFQGLPERVRVVVEGRAAGGETVAAEGTLEVVLHRSPNEYWFPLEGRWVAAAAPSLHSHHRWASLQEFALDLVQFGADGLTHREDGSQLSQYYAWGAPVLAVADGEVVSVETGMTESSANLQQPGESNEAYFQRTMEQQQALLAKGFATVLGNHVVIRHAHDEYSHYLHLKEGSVSVEVGDRVERGQPIGALGHSGNSTEPHLHFHVTDGPSLGYSRGLPVTFTNISLWPDDDGTIEYLNSGQVVVAKRP